ncbi:(2E,6E)-farnesyl diphosphate synthase [Gallaecimonas sp. GXIMD1310]|uniref:(2E,6E)-farnesyl diphosphate synthase n=1 Tax=Gallaecimonas sp. GXIMD1310 TaxID=3131926 RepID=UPI00324667F7
MTLTAVSAHYRQHIDQHLQNVLAALPNEAAPLHGAMHHALLLGGKRIRPFLVYATGQMLGLSMTALDPLATAVECIHAYSLVHDDLPAMDDDELRRGQPTVHVAFDEATAVLAGDALQTLAFAQLAMVETDRADCLRQLLALLSEAAGLPGMVGGQALDMAATGHQTDLPALERIHRLKTGALIRASVLLPAILADVDATQQQALSTFATALGLAFQVQDDILDVVSDTDTLGKTQGKDARDSKATYPALLGLDGAKDKAEQLVEQALLCLATLPYNSDILAELARFVVTREQ